MPIGGSATELNITGAKLKVAAGVQVAGSISYTNDATGFGSVTAQIDNKNDGMACIYAYTHKQKAQMYRSFIFTHVLLSRKKQQVIKDCSIITS